MQILVLAADGTRDEEDLGYPLCLTEIDGKPLIQLIVESCRGFADATWIVAMREADRKRWHLDNVMRRLADKVHMIGIEGRTAGATCTALLASIAIDPDEPLLILNGNDFISIDYDVPVADFMHNGVAAGAVVFQSVHPRYSYLLLDGRKRVVEAAEKDPISNFATAGFYWFSKAKLFFEAAEAAILKNDQIDGVYYICPSLNQLILRQVEIGVYEVPSSSYHPAKTSRQIERLEMISANGMPAYES